MVVDEYDACGGCGGCGDCDGRGLVDLMVDEW